MSNWSPQLQALIDKYGPEKAQAMAKLQLATYKKKYPTMLFVPNRGQWRMCEFYDRDNIPFMANFLAGNGVGKTALLVNMLVGYIWGRKFLHPNWLGRLAVWDKLPDKPRIRIVCHSDDMKQGGSLYDEIVQWFPKGHYELKKAGKTHYSTILADNGIEVAIKTHDQDVVAHAGPNLDIILCNEPMPQNLFGENMGRLRNSSCPIFATYMTPLSVSAWLYEQAIEGEDDVNTCLAEASIWDNCKDVPGTRGVLPRENIERIIEQWRREDPEQAEARITGKFQHLSGRIFKTFEPRVHCIEQLEIPKNWPLSVVVDPHDSRPPFVTFWAQDPLGNLYCIDEYPTYNGHRAYHMIKDTGFTYDHFADAIKKKMASIAPAKQWTDFVMDPNKGQTKIGSTNNTIRKEYANRGIKCRTKNIDDDLDRGHKKIQEKLYFDRDKWESSGELTVDNQPKIFFFKDKCFQTIQSMNKYAFKMGVDQGQSLTSKVEQTYKDPVDTVRYRCVSLRPYSNPKNEKSGTMAGIKAGRARMN
jgi:hypothetical protein